MTCMTRRIAWQFNIGFDEMSSCLTDIRTEQYAYPLNMDASFLESEETEPIIMAKKGGMAKKETQNGICKYFYVVRTAGKRDGNAALFYSSMSTYVLRGFALSIYYIRC